MRVRVGAVARLLVFVVVLFAAIVGTAAPTGAASVLDSSPRPGDVLAGPVPTIWLRFEEPIRVTPDTFEVVDHNGIDAGFTTQVNSAVVTLTFDEPLPAGRYRLVWAVGQSDSVRRGVLPFEVIVDGAADSPGLSGQREAQPLVDGPLTATTLNEGPGETPLGEFRTRVGEIVTWERAGEISQTVRDVAALVMVGSLLFIGRVHTGAADEIRWLVRWTRSAGVVAAVAAIAMAATTVAQAGSSPIGSILTPSTWTEALTTTAWFELGAVVAAAIGSSTLSGRRGVTPVVGAATFADQQVIVGAGAPAQPPATQSGGQPHGMSWRFDVVTAPGAIAGTAVAVFALGLSATIARDGGLLLFPLALLHTAAAAAWLGTTAASLAVLSRRFASRHPLDAPIVVAAAGRVVVVAAAALGITGLTGALVTGRSLGELFAGPKVTLLAAALATVVVNRVLLARRPARASRLGGMTRGLLTVEALLLCGAVLAGVAAVVG